MKDYKQFLVDTQNNDKLAAQIKSEMKKLGELYPDKTDRELMTIAAKAHGYGFNVLDILNTQVVMKIKKN
ncbi:MAG: hypothetical protein IJU82_03255 [Ruminiclostridium sp.]|nr:hypothetical protein [Ruminiclostridium sp.]